MRLVLAVALAGCSPVLGEGSHDLSHPRMAPMLDAHNAVRAAVEPAADPALPDLVWSDDLAGDAAGWTERCVMDHDPSLSGQGESWFAWSAAGDVDATDVVDAWASEVADYDLATNSCDGVCGHYTQIVWRDTTEVGCAFQECPSGLRNWADGHELWVCRYSPPGNVAGQSPY